MLTEKQRLQTAARQQRFRERQHQARRCEQEAKCELRRSEAPMPAISTMPGSRRWKAALQSAHALVAQVSEEMRRYSDDRSEAWHETESAETFDEHLNELEAVLDRLDNLIL